MALQRNRKNKIEKLRLDPKLNACGKASTRFPPERLKAARRPGNWKVAARMKEHDIPLSFSHFKPKPMTNKIRIV